MSGQLQCRVCGCPEGGQDLSPGQCSGQCKGQRSFQNNSDHDALSHPKASQQLYLKFYNLPEKYCVKELCVNKVSNQFPTFQNVNLNNSQEPFKSASSINLS